MIGSRTPIGVKRDYKKQYASPTRPQALDLKGTVPMLHASAIFASQPKPLQSFVV